MFFFFFGQLAKGLCETRPQKLTLSRSFFLLCFTSAGRFVLLVLHIPGVFAMNAGDALLRTGGKRVLRSQHSPGFIVHKYGPSVET